MTVRSLDANAVKTFCEQLVNEGMIPLDGEGFSMRDGGDLLYPVAAEGGIVITAVAMDGPLEQVPPWVARHRDIHSRKKDARVLIVSRLPSTLACARAGITIPPLLDDFAQLVGVNARIIAGDSGGASFADRAVKGLVFRNAVMIRDKGGLCAAGHPDDAHAVVQVLEKNCRSVVDTFFFGGGRPIAWVDAWLMRLVYRYKYAKQSDPGNP